MNEEVRLAKGEWVFTAEDTRRFMTEDVSRESWS
jgi:hypothetical protein